MRRTAPFLIQLKPYIQPFERDLALLEATHFFDQLPISADDRNAQLFSVSGARQSQVRNFLDKSAYWLSISGPEFVPTRQAVWEATGEIARVNGSITIDSTFNLTRAVELLPNRRRLRYGVHGIHEYRGKYFPQLVRSLLNIAIGKAKSARHLIFDPMMGSGTTATEAVSLGYECAGVDMNPLSVLMAQTKANLVSQSYAAFARNYETFVRDFEDVPVDGRVRPRFLDEYSQADAVYIERWFSRPALSAIGNIAMQIRAVRSKVFRDFLLITLSNVLRPVSHQKVDDLRVRRVANPVTAPEVYDLFRKSLEKSAASVSALLYFKRDVDIGAASVLHGDARDFQTWNVRRSSVDCVITSPPYATALPYLDTDRLSLVVLGLLDRSSIRAKDYQMIGNREISKRQRDDIWAAYQTGKSDLPNSVCALIDTIYKANTKNSVGFRRFNMPYLLAKYFMDMTHVFTSMRTALKSGASAFIVIGDNTTTSGARRFDICSTTYLREIAESAGFDWIQTIPMEMLVSRDIHRDNALKSEAIIWLRK